MSLNLNQTYEIEKTIPIKININKPFAVSGNIPLNLEAKFRGSGWNLLRLFTSLNLQFNYDLNTRKKDKFIILTKEYLENSLGLSDNMAIVSTYPETLFVNIESYEEKYVKLMPKILIECMEGYQVVGKPILIPDSLKIGGAIDLLRNINHLNSRSFFFDGVNAEIIRNIPVSDSLSNLLWMSQNEVKLIVNVELTAEKEFTDVNISVSNIPSDKDVLLIPQTIAVHLKGGVNQLSKVDNTKIIAKIDFEKILSDTTGSITPKFEVPEGCTVIAAKPESIQYVIKKKTQ
ncbi:MAG: hypothetical protein K8I03_12505 [Ignavibacteria bacterium]|nr:hypothetical protein [Ignavibacteria bacterium]